MLPSRDNLSFALQLFSRYNLSSRYNSACVSTLVYVATRLRYDFSLRCNSSFTFQRSFFVTAANFCYKALLVAKPSSVFVNRFMSTRRLPFLLQHVPTLLCCKKRFLWLAGWIRHYGRRGWLAGWLNPPLWLAGWMAGWLNPPLWLAGWLADWIRRYDWLSLVGWIRRCRGCLAG